MHETERGVPGDAVPTSTTAGQDAAAPDADEPRLVPGQQLGRYEIVNLLGAGGMGRVYLARDPSLGREVAIKALAHAFRGDSGSLRRFEREARVLAALSHPNIAAIYGFEHLDGAPYLVLERVDGETLAQRLSRGPLSRADALSVAAQISDGLEEAHAKGVVHRDLKPSNVMLAPGDRAKLVDFGLAKTAATHGDTAITDLVEEPITVSGALLGTARYMSPEQVRGDEADTRTDVWAFGCLLYEMLTGRAAFAGPSVADVLAAVLRDEPDWTALPRDLPAGVHRLLRRCLQRDPRLRLQHIGDARLEIADASLESSPALQPVPPPVWPPGPFPGSSTLPSLAPEQLVDRPGADRPGVDRPGVDSGVDRSRVGRLRRWLPALVGLMAAAGAAVAWQAWPEPPRSRAVRLSLDLPAGVTLSSDYAPPFAVAPAGSPIVLEAIERGTGRLYARGLGDLALRPIAGTEGGRQPFFSPDGAFVAFFADRKLVKVPIEGGPALQLGDFGGNPRGASWAADGTLVVAPSQTSGLVRLSDRGGAPAPLTTLDVSRGEYSHRWPQVIPGRPWVLFTVGLESATFDEARIEAVSLETGERRRVLDAAGFARYLPDRRLLFVRGARVYVVPFDPERLTTDGAPRVVLDAVRYDRRNGGSHLAVSTSGVVIYGPGVEISSESYLSWMDGQGTLTRAVDTARPFRDPAISPDGRQIAVVVGTASASDLWRVEANGTFSRLSFGLSPHRPAWSPDGRHLTVGAADGGRWRLLTLPADGTGPPTVLLESPHRLYPNAWTPDGRTLVFQEQRPETGWDTRRIEVDASGRPAGPPRDVAATPAHESNAALSADGRWMAYESDELDAVVQVYLRSFPEGDRKVRVSPSGGRVPVFGRDGVLQFWQSGENRLAVARFRTDGPEPVVTGVERMWPRSPAATLDRLVVTIAGARYDVHADGRILVLETAGPDLLPAPARPVVVLDWADGPDR